MIMKHAKSAIDIDTLFRRDRTRLVAFALATDYRPLSAQTPSRSGPIVAAPAVLLESSQSGPARRRTLYL